MRATIRNRQTVRQQIPLNKQTVEPLDPAFWMKPMEMRWYLIGGLSFDTLGVRISFLPGGE
jgi:hypothetical protein